MPDLLLQKSAKNSKARDHVDALERRMHIWNSGNILSLLHEGETIQRCLSNSNKNKKPSALRFAFSACLFYNKQNFYCWTISFGKREWGTAEST